MIKNFLIIFLCTLLAVGCASTHRLWPTATDNLLDTTHNKPTLANPAFWHGSAESIWARISHIPLSELMENQSISDTATATWIKLAILNKRYNRDTMQLTQQLIAWRNEYPTHPGNSLFPSNAALSSLQKPSFPQHIAVLLPLQGPFAALGQAVRNGFLSAYYDSLVITHTPQAILFYDTSKSSNITALYQQALAKGANIVIGPLTKDNVETLSHRSQFSIPTIALNYTELWYRNLPPNFYQFGLSPLDEAQQVAEKAHQAGHTHAIIIAPQTEWGRHVVKVLTSRWQSLNSSVSETYYFTSKSNLEKDIPQLFHINLKTDHEKMKDKSSKQPLELQRRQDFDVIFLLASPQSAREIVPLLRYYYLGKIPIYATSTIYSGIPIPQKDVDLNGVLFCDTPWSLQQAKIFEPSKNDFRFNRLFAVGRDAYLLSHELPRLTTLPHFPIYAATGALTLNPQHQIYRHLPWAKMHNGQP